MIIKVMAMLDLDGSAFVEVDGSKFFYSPPLQVSAPS